MIERNISSYEFFGWGKRWYYGFLGVKGDLFQSRKLVVRSFLSIYKACMLFLEPKQMIFQFSKNGKMIFSVSWNTMFTDYRKVLVLNFSEVGNTIFKPKIDGKITFTDYWKFPVLNFSERGNTVFFWAKNLMEIYLLITEKFLFWIFRKWEIRFFLSQKVDRKIIFTWSFWGFHDVPGLGKYRFLCSDEQNLQSLSLCKNRTRN